MNQSVGKKSDEKIIHLFYEPNIYLDNHRRPPLGYSDTAECSHYSLAILF
jgi:hypothetical protein